VTLPVDIVAEREHSIAKLVAREARALARIRRALRTLADVRRKLARDRAEHADAVRVIAAAPARTPRARADGSRMIDGARWERDDYERAHGPHAARAAFGEGGR
jgi:hypothetical protein